MSGFHSGKLRLIKHTAQDPADSYRLATYLENNKTFSFLNAHNTFFAMLIFIISFSIANINDIQASQFFSIPESTENSQTLALLSPNFSLIVPQATGGPLYAAEITNDVLVSNIGVITDENYKGTIEDTHGISFYIVREGDTLSDIAELFDVSINTIKWENNLGKTLKVGQELRILPVSGISHIIKKRETFGKIAQMYDVEIEDITVFNNFDEKNLKVGEKIIIPNGVKKQIQKKSSSHKTSSQAKKSVGGKAKSGYYVRPTSGTITSRFGPRWGKYHYGIDFGGVNGVSSIVAAASGTVERTTCGRGYGNCLIIKHDNGTKTLYAHNSKLLVSKGTKVKKGQKISILGATGHVTGPHLHFEIIKSNGQKMNPNSLF